MVGAAAWPAKACARNADPLQQGPCTDAVVTLARRDEYGKRPPLAVAGEVNLGGQSAAGSAEGVIVRFVLPVDPPFSAGGGGVLVGAHDGGVDLDQPVDVPDGVRPGLYLLQGPDEHAVDHVAAEAGVDRLPRPVAFRQVTPRDAGTDLVDHPVDDLTVRHARPSRRGPRHQRSEQRPLLIGEFMAAYHPTMIHHPMIFEDGP